VRWVTAKRLFFLAVLLTVTLAVMRITMPERTWPAPLESKFRDILAPVQTGLTWAGRQARHLVSLPVSLIGTAERNRELKQEVARLKSEIIRLNEYRLGNRRLSVLLEYKQLMSYRFDFLAASVVARDPGNWFGTVTLNKGFKDGVQDNMSVLTPEGLVGRVVSVSDATCEVLLITDPRSGVGALVQDNRTPGIVEGVTGGLGITRMIHISNDAPVEKGQAVITSGLSSIYPKGVPIGEITDLREESSGLFESAIIRPYTDFNRLEEVLIVRKVLPEAVSTSEGG